MSDLKNKFNRVMKDLADNAGEQIKETGKYATEGLKDGALKFSKNPHLHQGGGRIFV